jgi:hypothetical protein
MRYENAHQPVILLLDGSPSADNRFIKRWFERSRFLTCEANDIFHAMEEISDFTKHQRPDVVLLEVASMTDDFQIIKRLTQTMAGQNDLLIFALSENGKIVDDKQCFEGDLTQLAAMLDNMIPVCSPARRAIAV